MVRLPAGYFHTIDCSIQYAQAKQQRARERQLAKANADTKKAQKAERAKHRADKEAIKPLSKLKSEAQAAFNKYIRLRDYWEPCISCGKPKEVIEADHGWKVGGCWDAGHFKTRGAKPQLRFNLFNVHKQCKSCNGGGGRFSAKAATVDAQYEANLIDKIGTDKVIQLKNNNNLVRFDAEYYRRIKKIFNKKARLMQKRINRA
tara:strand:- start:16208 stop:16816 length:609 start_codon:yes stop_codon:yes gene_type:complete